MTAMPRLKCAFVSHRGRVRQMNEDCVGIIDVLTVSDGGSILRMDTSITGPAIVVVADGLGGHRGGRFASEFVSRRLLAEASAMKDEDDLGEAIKEINRGLYQEMETHPEFSRMGATIAGLLVTPECLYGFNVGDSRLYELVPGPFVVLASTDDVHKGDNYDTSSRTGQAGHAVTQCIGGTARATEIDPHIFSRRIASGSVFLLCSDGLTDMLDQDAIEACVDTDIAVFAGRLFDQAMAAGGEDNISICVVQVE